MPVETEKLVDDISEWFLNNKMINYVATNPIYTSFIIVFIIILVIMFIFRDVDTKRDTDESLFIMSLRVGFWVLLFSTSIIFLHNKLLLKEKKIGSFEYDYTTILNNPELLT